MDVNSMISNIEHKRHCPRISNLPDEILVPIISSLPTREAIQTSVLSKRWVHLWRNISTVELKEEAPERRQQFIYFVRRLLEVCDWSSVEKFSLSCKVGKDASQVNEWLNGFINPKIQELNLDLKEIETSLIFPERLFTCATLTKFELSMQHVLVLPPSIRFRSLKTLTLEGVKFRDSCSTQKLFFGLLSLEELSLINCNWVNVKYVSICSPVLRKLIITEHQDDGNNLDEDEDDDVDDDDDDIGGQNVSNRCDVMIVGNNNLKSFIYDGLCANDYSLYGSTSVVKASILVGVGESDWDDDQERNARLLLFNVIKRLSNVEKLSISDISLLVMSSAISLDEYIPLFCNLAELCVVSLTRMSLSCEALLIILQNSPCLQVINFEGEVTLFEEDYTNLPMCFRTHLKTIKVNGFSGDVGELRAIKFLLQAASVLDTLCICCYSFDDDSPTMSDTLESLYKCIERFPKGSMDCKIHILCEIGT